MTDEPNEADLVVRVVVDAIADHYIKTAGKDAEGRARVNPSAVLAALSHLVSMTLDGAPPAMRGQILGETLLEIAQQTGFGAEFTLTPLDGEDEPPPPPKKKSKLIMLQ